MSDAAGMFTEGLPLAARTRSEAHAGRLIFSHIERVARQERERMFGPEPEPASVQMLRMRAAAESQQIIVDATVQADAIRAAARSEGFEAGYVAGVEAARSDCEANLQRCCAQLREAVQAVTDQVEAERRRLWSDAEPQIAAFVLEIAEKVIKQEARVNRDMAISVIKSALRRVVDSEPIRIRVNIEDLETVRSSRDEIASVLDGVRHIEIVDDRRVAPGGCVIDTASGAIDARIETQMEELRRAAAELDARAA